MSVRVRCSNCQGLARVREAILGKTVRCPACSKTFVAHPEADPIQEAAADDGAYSVQADAPSEAPARPRRDERGGQRRRSSSDADEEADHLDVRPHRGALILTLGICSIVFSCVPLAGFILGGVAMSMGSADDRLMEDRLMNRSGQGMTKAGQICGIVGVFFAVLNVILNVVVLVHRLEPH